MCQRMHVQNRTYANKSRCMFICIQQKPIAKPWMEMIDSVTRQTTIQMYFL